MAVVGMVEGTASIPTHARVHLAHAALQRIAEGAGVDVLHLKGPAVSRELQDAPRRSTDVDLLVRPAHVKPLEVALRRHGWQEWTHAETGSAFGHAANWHHPAWGYVDLHAHWPGPAVSPDTVFDTLAAARRTQRIAQVDCPVPDVTGQLLVMLLHVARSPDKSDLAWAWHRRDESSREAIRALARDLDAELALAAAVGGLEAFADHPDYLLWRYFSLGGSRLDEWRARWRAARGPAAKARVVLTATRLNREILRMELGHAPSPREIRRAHRDRVVLLIHEVRDRLRGRRS